MSSVLSFGKPCVPIETGDARLNHALGYGDGQGVVID